MLVVLGLTVLFLPFVSSKPFSYQSQNGRIFSLSRADVNEAQVSDAFNLGNAKVLSNSTTFTMTSGPPGDLQVWSIFTETFPINLPYPPNASLTFAGTSNSLDFAQDAVRIFVRMLSQINVVQQSYVIGRPEERHVAMNNYQYYSIALTNRTTFSFTRNLTSDLLSEGLNPSPDWTIVWVGFGFIRYAPVSSAPFVLSMDRHSFQLNSNQTDFVTFSAGYTTASFLSMILVGSVSSVAVALGIWYDARRGKT